MTKANREKWRNLSNEYEFLSWQIEALNKRLFEVLDAMDKLIEEDEKWHQKSTNFVGLKK